MTTNDTTTTNVVPVAPATLKRNKRNQSPKKTAANITDLTEKKTEKKSTKAEKKPVEKKAPAEKTPKISKTLSARPIRDLSKVKFVPNWVYANLPDVLHEPSDQKFSFLALYLEVRHQAELAGKVYYELTVGEMIELLQEYAKTNADPLADRIKSLKPLQYRDLKARLQWLLCPTLTKWDIQVKTRQDAQEAKDKK